MNGQLALDQQTMQRMAAEAQRKAFRVQVAMSILLNDDLHKLANRSDGSEEAKKAHQLRNRCLTIVEKAMDEAD